jgi:processing peptidase subunit beta
VWLPISVSDLRRAGQPLGRTILGPKKNIISIKRDDLASYIKTNYTADHMVLVGAGGVDHEKLIKSGGESIRDASCLTEPDPTQLQGSPKAGLCRVGGVHS